jgi:hypothetical protein
VSPHTELPEGPADAARSAGPFLRPGIPGGALWCSISAFGDLQNVFGRLTDSEGISRSSYEGNYRPSVPNLVSVERDYVVDIYVDGLPMFVGALDPGPHGYLPVLAEAAKVDRCLPLVEHYISSRRTPLPAHEGQFLSKYFLLRKERVARQKNARQRPDART